MTRVIVTGSREWTASFKMRAVLRELAKVYGSNTVIVHGNARGADQMAARYAPGFGLKTESHPAEWEKYGRAAGPIRNQCMVELGADFALAFFVCRLPCVGTRHCVELLQKAEIPVRKYYQH